MSENTRKPVMNMLWPILGGDHTDADTWHEIDAALTTYGDERYQAAIADVVEWLRECELARGIPDDPAELVADIADEITRRFGKGQDRTDLA